MEYEITKKVSPPHGVWNLILNGRVWRFFGKQQYYFIYNKEINK